ncbi:uncharacterized protein LOC120684924 [Panicum virgatum]|uniref:uncharacterized protein LOC120684924 n=1 Tax=Panicum virgatum TaxID=38727 RepID=UPI0019D513A0|nr:uncharacterized protein LOC120684924 [Panicum virgatum]
MLAAKLELLMKKLESPHQEVNQVSESRMTCETCGETGHSGTSCPLTQEGTNFVGNNNNPNSGFRPQQGWNSKPNLPFSQQQGKQRKTVTASHTDVEDEEQEEAVESNTPATQEDLVPMYAKYIKDILGNKRMLPTTKVMHLTEECSAAILDPLLVKKKDPGYPTITCSIRAQHFSNALCDLGASVSVMPKLADQTVRYPTGIAENIPVKIRNFFIPIDFVVLDMEVDAKMPLIVGRLFLSTANAHIDDGAGEIHLNITG